VAPERVAIEYGPQGKPLLAVHHPRVEFSVSHCGPVAAIAIATVPLGVDVERVRHVADVNSMAAQVFSADEQRALAEAADSSTAFLRGWTRKEAVLKARGTGFSADARQLTVSLDGVPTLRLEGGEAAGWTLLDVSRGDHVAALAVQASDVALVVSVPRHRVEPEDADADRWMS
jgi:4'-phosphopantetheinyl transferase